MKRISSILLTGCCSLVLALVAAAQETNKATKAPEATQGTNAAAKELAAETPAPPPSAPAQRSAADLEKLAMPIALHPDPLVAIILPASVYPVEIVQAARFV